jgi:PleD family two-component response regulator
MASICRHRRVPDHGGGARQGDPYPKEGSMGNRDIVGSLTFETLTVVMVPINRIMVVEDEDGIRDLLYELLVDAGLEIVQLATADAAFQLLERESLQLLLTDVNIRDASMGYHWRQSR